MGATKRPRDPAERGRIAGSGSVTDYPRSRLRKRMPARCRRRSSVSALASRTHASATVDISASQRCGFAARAASPDHTAGAPDSAASGRSPRSCSTQHGRRANAASSPSPAIISATDSAPPQRSGRGRRSAARSAAAPAGAMHGPRHGAARCAPCSRASAAACPDRAPPCAPAARRHRRCRRPSGAPRAPKPPGFELSHARFGLRKA